MTSNSYGVAVCRKEACRIQTCLQENGYQQEKCQDVINKLIKCCLEKTGAEEDIRCSAFLKGEKKKANNQKHFS